MLKKLKKKNRGILLAILVLLCFLIWINVSGSNFKNEEADNIKAVMSSYCDAAEELYTLEGEESASAEEKEAKYEAYINSYWSYSKYMENQNIYGLDYYVLRDSMLEEADNFADVNEKSSIKEIDYEITLTKVKKAGDSGAKATADFSVTYSTGTLDAQPVIIIPDGCMSVEPSTGKVTYTWEDVTVMLEKVDGEWKIVGMLSYWLDISY